jgi:hypothetical protein
MLKDEWIFIRDTFDESTKEAENKGEFETSQEFQARASHSRQGFIEKINKHLREGKFDTREFSVWFNAQFVSYDADAGVYSLRTSTSVEAPYDIPSVECSVPFNPYVEMTDSVRGGYRTSSIRLKFDPDFKWKVARNDAMTAKASQENIWFKVTFVLDLSQEHYTKRALFKIVPKEIMLVNRATKLVWWKEEILK